MISFRESLSYKDATSFNWFILVAVICFMTAWSKAQTVNPFPLVNVTDTPADFDPTTPKVYITTVALVPVINTATFVPSTFIQAAEDFYSRDAGLSGYIGISDVQSASGSGSTLLVTYNVAYNLAVLQSTDNINNEMILSTIGNYQQIRANVGSAIHALSSFYRFEENADNFVFTGSSICNQPGTTCVGSQLQCNEALDGMTVTCTSPCKLGFCQNNGTCAQENVNAQPTCTCLSKADVWFLGAQCETFFALWMVILIVVGCFFLIVIAIIIACCVYSAKRRKAEKLDSENVKYFTNKAFEKDEVTKVSTINAITTNGYSVSKPENNTVVPVAAPRRSRTPSDRYNSRSRRHRSRSDSRSRRNRSRRSYDSRRNHRRHSSSLSSNSSVSSYEDSASFDDSSSNEVRPVTIARVSSAAPQHEGSTSSDSSDTPVKGKSSATSREIEYSDIDFSETHIRDQGTSPIRWNPTTQTPEPAPGKKMGKIDIAQRKGWQPSLGPQMFELEREADGDATLPSTTRLGKTYTWDTDI